MTKSQQKPARIYVVGSIYMDVVVTTPYAPPVDGEVWGADVSWSPGGRGANQAIAAARAGGNVALISVLGDDAPAVGLKSFLEAESLNLKLPRAAAQATGLALSLTDGTTSWVVDAAGANLSMTPDAVESIAFTQRDVLLLQNEIPLEVNRAAAARARSSGTTVIWNMAPFRTISESDALAADFWILNRKEFATLSGLGNESISFADFGRLLTNTKWLGRNLIVTLDVDGVLAKLDDSVMHLSAYEVDQVDPVGAGDCFCGVFAAAIANRSPPTASLEIANVAAGLSVQRTGAASGMPYLIEIWRAADERIRKHLS